MIDNDSLKKIPRKTGIYIMKDEQGNIIYVGKAVNLHNRVRSYFQKSQNNIKTQYLAANITSVECVVTDNESEAFILENNLIKQHNPKYNIRLKDDKAYPYIKITNESFPRILFANRRGKDKARYYGPYVCRTHVRETLELLHRLWPLRRCKKVFPRDFNKSRTCLNHHIKQCKAPCNRLLPEEAYNTYVAEAEAFIQGKDTNVEKRLQAEMHEAAENMEFERAAELRDTITALKTLNEKQKIETGEEDRDIIAIARQANEALIQIFFIREGKLTNREHYIMTANESEKDAEIFAAFIKQFYSEAAFIPRELVLPNAPTEKESIAAWLANLTGRQVTITIPQKGEKRKLLQLAQTNAQITIQQFGAQLKKEAERNAAALAEIAAALSIPPPTRIEAYDISNIHGTEAVGSMVVFENGKAKNNDYRKFKIHSTVDPNDYLSMQEVLTRRFKRYTDNSESFNKLPDLILVDGGKGHVSTVEKALQGIKIPVAGMVKDDRHKTRGLIHKGEEIPLPRASEGFKLIIRIQDEVHRFAIEYHRKLRADTQTRSILDDIDGIGKTRRRELLKHFKNIEAIKNATQEELTNAPAMNRQAAEAVYNFFKGENEQCQQ